MCQPAIHTLHWEAGVGDDSQHVVVILLVPVYGFLVGGGQHHLWTSTLALGGSMGVQCFCREVLRLLQDIIIEVGKHGGVEADVVLHQEYHLHAGLLDVVLDVHLVLNQFDDREDEVGIAQPAEHIVENRQVFMLDTLGDAV